MEFTSKFEGGCQNWPNDKGNYIGDAGPYYTCWGITPCRAADYEEELRRMGRDPRNLNGWFKEDQEDFKR
jgi:hypothetical protein